MNTEGMQLELGPWSKEGLDRFLSETSGLAGAGRQIDVISGRFLGTAYGEATLVGGPATPERLVINFRAVDCFTFADYVEALRLSASFDEFVSNLKRVRYASGKVSYDSRNHFLSDWTASGFVHVRDVTASVGGAKTAGAAKTLNLKDDGSFYVPGIAPRRRTVRYLPGSEISAYMLERLKTGDYAGIFSEKEGLDVSHVGIIIRGPKGLVLRHASAHQGKVVDEDFRAYMSSRPGLLILRPLEAGRGD